jgi:hypothetical protein
MQPEVSVVTGTRNRPLLLRCALASIATQTFQNYEVLIVDDGSLEETVSQYSASLSEFDERFRLIRLRPASDSGSGPGAVRNVGIEAGRGAYVAFLDDDDVWTCRDHLRRAIAALKETGSDIYCANMQGNRGAAVVIPNWFQGSPHLWNSRPLTNHADVRRTSRLAFLEAVLRRTPHPNAMVVTRRLIGRTGAFPEWVRTTEDLGFILRLLDGVDEVLFCNRVVARYRMPEGDANSLQYTDREQALDGLFLAQSLGISAKSEDVRVTARKVEAWTLRQLSQSMQDSGRRGKAVRLALQALTVYPTAGALWQAIQTLVPRRSLFGTKSATQVPGHK